MLNSKGIVTLIIIALFVIACGDENSDDVNTTIKRVNTSLTVDLEINATREWKIFSRPVGSIATIKRTTSKRSSIIPDIDGIYNIGLINSFDKKTDYIMLISTTQQTSGPNIVCWGDSLTYGYGAGSVSKAYPDVLSDLTGLNVINSGVSGENSVTISGRSGAIPLLIHVNNNQIPAFGQVEIEFLPIDGVIPKPLELGDGIPDDNFTGVLSPLMIRGSIILEHGVYYFVRETDGVTIAVNDVQTFTTDFALARRGDIAIIWIGQNGPSILRSIEEAKKMVLNLTALDKRWLVIPYPGSNDSIDGTYTYHFGDKVLLIRKYMVEPIFGEDNESIVSCNGLRDANITATEQDLYDISKGVIPSSLRVDSVHWNAAGYKILAQQIKNKMEQLNWLGVKP